MEDYRWRKTPPKLHEKIPLQRPDLVGKRVWFCPNKVQNLECVINEDGTVSVCGSPGSFRNSKELIAAIISNKVNVGETFKLPRTNRLSNFQFTTHLFVQPNRGTVNYYVSNPGLPLPTAQSPGSSICKGFTVNDPVDLELIQCQSIKIINGHCHSRYCSGTKAMASSMCKDCVVAQSIFRKTIKRKKCPGLQDVFNPLNRIRSELCPGVKEAQEMMCTHCKQKQRYMEQLKKKREKRQTPRARRIRFSGDHLLTEEERTERRKMIAQELRLTKATVNKMKKTIAKKEAEITKRKSEIPEIDRALIEQKKSLEARYRKLKTPKCVWEEEPGRTCDGGGSKTLDEVSDHVNTVHIRPQIEDNSNLDDDRKFTCRWVGCGRVFKKQKVFVTHVMSGHVGDKDQLAQLESDLCAMSNSNVPPNARRYNDQMREMCIRQYKSQSSWQRTRNVSTLPLPSLSTILKMKKVGSAKTSIDQAIQNVLEKTTDTREHSYSTFVYYEEPGSSAGAHNEVADACSTIQNSGVQDFPGAGLSAYWTGTRMDSG